MGVETAIIASAIIAAGTSAVAANKQKQKQEQLAEQQKKMAEEQLKQQQEANDKALAEQESLNAKDKNTKTARSLRRAFKTSADSMQGKAGTILSGNITGGDATTTSKTLLGN